MEKNSVADGCLSVDKSQAVYAPEVASLAHGTGRWLLLPTQLDNIAVLDSTDICTYVCVLGHWHIFRRN